MSFTRRIVSHSPLPMVTAARSIRDLGRERSARKHVQSMLRAKTPISLELGSGRKKGTNGWTTIDVVPGCDMYCNLAKGIPFPDASVQNIYSSHFLEHLTYQQTQTLLRECLRVMVPGGRFSICVPNARIYLEAYITGLPFDEEKFLKYELGFNRTTKIDYVNYIAYMNVDHKYMFDEENLVHILEKSGFREVRIRSFDPALDLKERELESIHAEGFK